jgi:hypothetical protein
MIFIPDDTENDKKEIADIFHLYCDEYIKEHPLPAHYLKVIHDITVCRTEYLGGHIYKCNLCVYEIDVYNSCRNRHCPKCQFTARIKWVEKRKSEILPVGYFHDVFTLPHDLNPLILRNKNVCLNLLFKSVGETLLQFGKGELKGQVGFIAILHTWSQTLLDHFHIHCVIPAGAISQDRKQWINSHDNFMFSVEAMSKMFRGKYIDYLKKAYVTGKLTFPGKIEYLSNNNTFNNFVNVLWKKEWVVYSKKPFSDPETVLEYLSRYTHRVAIANHRIISITACTESRFDRESNGKVTFKYKDRKNDNIEKEMILSAEELIRRFLLHILPHKFMKIRYYGFLGNRNRKDNVHLCRELLSVNYVESADRNTVEVTEKSIGIDITTCPKCKKGQMQTVGRTFSDFERKKYYDTS